MNAGRWSILIGLIAGGFVANACGVNGYIPCDIPTNDAFNLKTCKAIRANCRDPNYDADADQACHTLRRKCLDPNEPLYQHWECVGIVPEPSDGGTDADAAPPEDAASDADSEKKTCVANEPEFLFKPPQLVWFGPRALAPKECPDVVGSTDDIAYFAMKGASSEGCPKCACGPIEGSCSPTPNTIHLRSALCSEPEALTTDLGPPEGWDGSCSSNHKVAANAECPAGSGIPCAQSIYVSALPNPVEGCKPLTMPIPHAITDVPTWGKVALSCNVVPEEKKSSCVGGKLLPELPNEVDWRYCVRGQNNGVYECDSDRDYKYQVLTYPEKSITDHRYCTECGCEASGGTCYGAFGIYEDETCTKLLTQDLLSSDTFACSDINPAGLAVGSKQLKDLLYAPGKCEPTGGLPAGTVEVDSTNVVTWCCTEEVITEID